MTNYEKYKNGIDTMCECGKSFGLINGEIYDCDYIDCSDCDFNNGNCAANSIKWLVSEYEEPSTDWSKMPVDTPILVRDREDHKWKREYFAKYENDKVYAWRDGRSSWTAKSQDDVVNWIYAKLVEE